MGHTNGGNVEIGPCHRMGGNQVMKHSVSPVMSGLVPTMLNNGVLVSMSVYVHVCEVVPYQ